LRANNAAALKNRGLVHLRMNDPGAAMADYDAAIAMDPTNASALYGRGLAKHGSGDAKGGDADTHAAMAIRPDIAGQFAKWGVIVKSKPGGTSNQAVGERKNAR
jgi:tetratricopeptide (TPR) repeat protein